MIKNNIVLTNPIDRAAFINQIKSECMCNPAILFKYRRVTESHFRFSFDDPRLNIDNMRDARKVAIKQWAKDHGYIYLSNAEDIGIWCFDECDYSADIVAECAREQFAMNDDGYIDDDKYENHPVLFDCELWDEDLWLETDDTAGYDSDRMSYDDYCKILDDWIESCYSEVA